MLLGLSIRDIVLVDRLDLAFHPGLCVLTGETGAGKSILLDALGLALGARADASLVRHGSGQGSVAAEFAIAADHGARALLADHGLAADEGLVLRRVVGADGRSRAFVNDQPVSVGLLRRVGETLVEIHGQSQEQGLFNPAMHREILDAFAGTEGAVAEVRAAHGRVRDAAEAVAAAAARLAAAQADEAYLRHALEELDELDPHEGEEARLAAERTALMHGEKLAEAVREAAAALDRQGGVEAGLRAAQRALDRVERYAAGRFDEAATALDRAAVEAAEAVAALAAAERDLEPDPGYLERIEERLFALRAAARKHRVQVDDLPALRDDMAARLEAIEDGGAELARLEKAADEARADYGERAARLSAARRDAARALDAAVASELEPLKLGGAVFRTVVETVGDGDGGPDGIDRVSFRLSTVPGHPPGPLTRIASGGELSRFMLALKVALMRTRSTPTLIFDEVDRGVGGATANAVGERLARLAGTVQVVVVTHSPQVAARGDHHWRISKEGAGNGSGGSVVSRVIELDTQGRREEIARMLAGAEVTEEARAAAASLITGRGP